MKIILFNTSCDENQWLHGTVAVGVGIKLDLHCLYTNPRIFLMKSIIFHGSVFFL